MHRLSYPFAAIVGQERAKKALMLNLINPRIGGVLLSGEKGTAKSTVVRGVAQFGNKQVIDLPLNVTEDMLVGSIDFETTIRSGKRKFSGGVLERANGNILYVDEINLLTDSIASTVVCVATSGENLVEREGISERHDCSFLLVGTMNPEEGGLRPQLLDKFGLYVGMDGESDVESRVEIIRRRIAYERDMEGFIASYQKETENLQKKLEDACKVFKEVSVSENVRNIAVKLAAQTFCEGNRAELLLIETASAVAALDGRKYVTVGDIKEAAEYVLPHRRREVSQENESPDSSKRETDSQEETTKKDNEPNQNEVENNKEQEKQNQTEAQEETEESSGDEEPLDAEVTTESSKREDANAPKEDLIEGEEIYQIVKLPGGVRDRMMRKGSGRRRKTNSSTNKGRYAGFSTVKIKEAKDLALDATLRAAAPFQKDREKNGCAVIVQEQDFRYKKRENHVGATILFVVDASGSMGAAKRMKETKEAVLSMLMDSYQKRDKIGIIAFRQKRAEVLLDITSSVDLAQKKMQSLPTGGRTPLADGLYQAWQLLHARWRKDSQMLPLLVLVTDGRANSPLWSDDSVEDALKAARLIASERIPAMVVDTENDFISFHLAEKIAAAMEGSYFKVKELKSTGLREMVSLRRGMLDEFTEA